MCANGMYSNVEEQCLGLYGLVVNASAVRLVTLRGALGSILAHALYFSN
jgi:hypothetical protein